MVIFNFCYYIQISACLRGLQFNNRNGYIIQTLYIITNYN